MTPVVLPRRGRWRAVMVGTGLVALTAFVIRPDPIVLVCASGVVGYLVAQALRSQLTLSGDGTLVSRGVLPGSVETVDLAALRRVECSEKVSTRGGGTGPGAPRPRRVVRHELRITDARGRALTLEPSRWEPPDAVLHAVAAAAHAQGVDVGSGELFGIGEPEPSVLPDDPAPGPRAPATPPASPVGPATPSANRATARPLPGPDGRPPVRTSGTARLRPTYGVLPVAVLGVGAVAVPLVRVVVGVSTGAWPGVLAVAAVLAVAIAAAVIASTATSLQTDETGRLEVRSWPPFVTRSVRLDRLVSVEARAGGRLVATMTGRYRRNTMIRLDDADGGRVALLLDAWEERDWLLDVLGERTRRCGVAINGPTRRLLADGEPPQPAA